MQIQELKRKNPLTKKRQIGRGGSRGDTSGRGIKGQKARAGHKIRPEIRDAIKKIPKKRGYRFSVNSVPACVVSLVDLNGFLDNQIVSPQTLVKKKIISLSKGRLPVVKILGQGELKIKGLIISNCQVSKTAATKIEAVGGQINQINQ